ncbi:MAG: hypothetical protein ABGZ53_29245, partial [Fuerstiella sp.]
SGVNDVPTLDAIGNLTIAEDASEQTVNLTGITAGGGETQPLRVTASSSSTGLIPNPTVTYTTANPTGSIAFTPVADQSSTATITVTVEDGGPDGNLSTAGDNATVSRTFDVIVAAVNDAPSLAVNPSVRCTSLPVNASDPVSGSTNGALSVDSLVGQATSPYRFFDKDGDAAAIAITEFDDLSGRLWFSVDNGITWRGLTSASRRAATLLFANSTTWLHYTRTVHDSSHDSTLFRFIAWDRTGPHSNGATGIDTVAAFGLVVVEPDLSSSSTTIDRSREIGFVGANDVGLNIYDVDSRSEWSHIATVETSRALRGVLADDGTTFYLADSFGGLKVIDTSAPALPQIVSTLPGTNFGNRPDAVNAVAVSSDPDIIYRLLWADARLEVVDVSDPAIPEVLSTLPLTGYGDLLVASEDRTLLYAVTRTNGVTVVDTSSPRTPVVLTSIDTLDATGIAFAGSSDRGFIADRAGGVLLLDMSNPASPYLEERLGLVSDATDVYVHEDTDTLWVAQGSKGVAVFDLTVDGPPNQIGVITTMPVFRLSHGGTHEFVSLFGSSADPGFAQINAVESIGMWGFGREQGGACHPLGSPPTVDTPRELVVVEDASEQTVNLTGITAGGGETQPLRVTTTSSKTSLIPNPAVTYTSAEATGTLKFTPVADQSGTATITVTVED